MFASAQRWEVKGKQYLDYPLMHYTSDGIIEVGAIPFLLDASILDKALAD